MDAVRTAYEPETKEFIRSFPWQHNWTICLLPLYSQLNADTGVPNSCVGEPVTRATRASVIWRDGAPYKHNSCVPQLVTLITGF